MIEARHIEALKSLLGEKGLLTAAADVAAYETGARYDRGRASFVARPTSTKEVSTVIAYCVKNNIALVPQSGNTGLVSGSTPDDSGCQGVLSLDRLTGIYELDRVNRTVKVGAGLRLSDLNGKLGESGLFFPIDLGADPLIGGMIATNTGGSRFLRYGDVRRNTLGLTVVLADDSGTVLDLSSSLRKNNTGVDWKHLFIGTSGAFGVITECVLNLESAPRQTATALLMPSSGEQVPALLVAMEEALGSYLSAFEGMSGNAIRAALDHVPSLRNPFQGSIVPEFVILAEISRSNLPRDGEQPLDGVLEEVLAALWEREDAPLADALVGPPHEIWALRHALSEGVKHSGRLIAFDLSFRRGDIMRFLAQMRAEMPKHFPGITICDFGHIGDGGVHFNLVVAKNDPRLAEPGFDVALREWVFAVAVEEFGGSFSAEHAIGRKNQAFYDKYTPAEIRLLASGLKAITSPGPMGAMTF
ncbi:MULTISPECIES: FAD-binding oxidoreductase [Rhizobium]|uniref:FAD/FMN-containing dehydrogenase n=1 Tax=Rhizobium paranaense TaxID=1650438 RepID=A0A7W9D259_9HYPH|nr:FAD-binding oxidoreductase [Rhizobium paranaense]MBB5574760.1 FAD/FMN-containing dehydrogenase [Rhizobium paranaense]